MIYTSSTVALFISGIVEKRGDANVAAAKRERVSRVNTESLRFGIQPAHFESKSNALFYFVFLQIKFIQFIR